jgi:hypothetical protein
MPFEQVLRAPGEQNPAGRRERWHIRPGEARLAQHKSFVTSA